MAWTEPKTWVPGEIVTATDLNTFIRDNLNSLLPIAALIYRVAPYTDVLTAVEGRWLQCNGVAVSRTTYAALFAYFNSLTPALPFGVGDGSTTFNLPDFRGRTPYAQGTHASVDALGDSEGATLVNRSPQHKHAVHLAGFTGSPGNLIVGSPKDTGETSAPTAAGPSSAPLEHPSYLVAGSWFLKYK